MAYDLKPFFIDFADLAFLLDQVNFRPLFDALGNGVVQWDGSTAIYDAKGVLLSNGSGNPATQATLITQFGQGFASLTDPTGIRDVTGLHNNLFSTQQFWGAVDKPFVRQIAADFAHYAVSDGAGGVSYNSTYTPNTSVTDIMPRIISRTITTGGVNLLTESVTRTINGNPVTKDVVVVWDAARYASDAGYRTLIDNSGLDMSLVDPLGSALDPANHKAVADQVLVEGMKIVAPSGLTLAWDSAIDVASQTYVALLSFIAAGGVLVGSATGGDLVDGGGIFLSTDGGATGTQIGTLTFNSNLFIYHDLVVASGANTAALAAGDSISVTTANITAAIAAESTIGTIAPATVNVLLGQESGYGLLDSNGQIDYQNPNSGEHFVGQENPGVSPVNSWFGIFGQFFDHGLDFIDKGGNGKVTITLAANDPLYGALGPDGQPVTSITISRATNTGTAADPSYVDHTSPFIDQSQTYGSSEQITNLLREWVSTDGGVTYHAGIRMFDGQTLKDTWDRRWPDGSTQAVRDTLPTLNELRDHVIDTNRAALTWEDVTNYHSSGHALLLDMNPRFDAAHLNPNDGKAGTNWDDMVTAKVNAAFATITASFTSGPFAGATLGIANDVLTLTFGGGTITGVGALIATGLINPATFAINAPAGALHNAVGEILMAAVGDHYIAGDGRVNENFGLTSIHHVFHEEHNYQVENLKSYIYKHDTNNSPLTHDELHKWQVQTAFQDAQGNYHYGSLAGEIAWDADKMFNASKLMVEMEYQHAAVDQYSRTITPRIQEVVGYTAGVNSAISLEFSQVAFRFGHSTIRETIDTVDPSGWMKGHVTRFALEKAFLNPQQFAESGIQAITLGLARQQMNEVDEFVTPALNQGLLGQPLDLAAINIARGRDLGIPTLNDFRAGIGLAKYISWSDFGKHMIHPDSLVNFIAAYAFGDDANAVAKAQYILDLASGAAATAVAGFTMTVSDAIAFMNNSTGAAAGADGFNHIDSWIGGLAEEHMPGSLLGETFEAIFVNTIQQLIDGDRFYYLYRLFGTNLNEEVGNGQFKDIVERNTGLSHLNGSIFGYADQYYDFNLQSGQVATLQHDDVANHIYFDTIAAKQVGIYSDGGVGRVNDSTVIHIEDGSTSLDGTTGRDYILDTRVDDHPDWIHPVEGTPTGGADSVEVIVATDYGDFIHGRAGDDTIYGEKGNDIIYADNGADRSYGGAGDDYIDTGSGPDLADGGAGKDQIWGRDSGSEVGGFDQLVGGSGNDLVVGGEGIDKLSGGAGDDIIFGDGIANVNPDMANTDPFTHGGDGNDYLNGGMSGDLLYGDEGDDYIVGGGDQDFIEGDNGDDILQASSPSQAMGAGPVEVLGGDGTSDTGFDLLDLSTYPSGGTLPNGGPNAGGKPQGVSIELTAQVNPVVTIDPRAPAPIFTGIEGIIATVNDDTLVGDANGDATADVSHGKNWLIGGSGNDKFAGGGGTDLIVGGSVRLDTLIGKYTDASTTANKAIGTLDWVNQQMSTGGTAAGYDSNTEDAYSGASNRATGALGAGFIDGVNAGIAGTANDLEKHFTEMLRSRMFKDLTLGDGGSDAGSTDTAFFVGNRNQYTITALKADGTVESNPSLAFAWKVQDNFNGDRTLQDGTVIGNDGIDVVVGVEALKFADRTVFLTPKPATGNVAFQLANNQGNNANAVVLTGTSALFDMNNATPTNPLGAVTNGIGYQWFDAATNAVIAPPTGNGNANNISQVTTTGTGHQVYLKANFTDALGVAESIQSKTWNLIVGTSGNNTLTGADAGTPLGAIGDAIFGLGGADTLNGGIGDDYLVGGAGTDTLNGGDGNDTYIIENNTTGFGAATFDSISETATGGTDTVIASLSYTLAANVENLTLQQLQGGGGGGGGGANNFNGTGNALDNVLTGNSGNNVLDGGGQTIGGGDMAVFAGSELNAVARINTAGNVTINVPGQGGGQGGGGGTGTDTLINIEKLKFDGGVFSLVKGTNGVDTVATTGTAANDYIVGGQGNDTISGGAGDDIVVWGADNAPGGNGPALTDGRDFIDGGTDTSNGVDGGDRVIINGNNQQEVFTIYSNLDGSAANAGLVGLNANTEIVITRTVGNVTSVIAELDNIEEITINALDVSANDANGGLNGGQTGGQGGGDTVNVVGDFTATSLKYSTITVNGDAGNNTVDISGLKSAHRIVLNGNGGTDKVVGQARSQDLVYHDAMGGSSASSGTGTDTGTGTGTGTGTDTGTGSGTGTDTGSGTGSGTGTPDGTDDDTDTPMQLSGDDGDDELTGGDADDDIKGADGDDDLSGGLGNDKVWGGKGNDSLSGDDGEDEVHGGRGNDTFVAQTDDDADDYYGDGGSDTLDMSAILTRVSANLGARHGQAFATTHGVKDVLHGIENIKTGAGNDTIVASGAHNVMDGGAGKDTFVFKKAAHANGDTINGFESGDKIDVSGFMGHHVKLVNGHAHHGQIQVTYETHHGQEFTVLHGNTDHDAADEFVLNIRGHHNLTGANIA